MKGIVIILCLVAVTSLNQPRQSTMSRRMALVASLGVPTVGGCSFVVAATTSLLLPANAAAAEGSDENVFCGTYSDPINHPGGTRTIRLVGDNVGEYQLAQVVGGGGIGEPKSYVLPAVVIGDRAIIIDFSPKGGPKDFTGVIDKGGIKFLRDGNKWPRIG